MKPDGVVRRNDGWYRVCTSVCPSFPMPVPNAFVRQNQLYMSTVLPIKVRLHGPSDEKFHRSSTSVYHTEYKPKNKNGGGLGAIQARLIMGFELNKLLSMDFTIYRNDRTGNARLVPGHSQI